VNAPRCATVAALAQRPLTTVDALWNSLELRDRLAVAMLADFGQVAHLAKKSWAEIEAADRRRLLFGFRRLVDIAYLATLARR